MKNQSRQQKIRNGIIAFYKSKGKSFTTHELLKYIHGKINSSFIMNDTIMREMRQLRQDKVLDYNCPVAKDMVYFILKKPK